MTAIKEISKICYYRWEFMRRDPEYQKDYDDFQRQIEDLCVDASHEYNMDKYAENLFGKYDLDQRFLKITGPSFLPNYNKKFDDLEDELDKYGIPILLFFSSDAVIVNNKFENHMKNPYLPEREDELELSINLSEVNSFSLLKHWIEYLIQNNIKNHKKNKTCIQRINIPKDPEDWERIIFTGDMRKENYSYSQIANKLLANNYISNDDPESYKQYVRNYIKRYEWFTQGGWRKIKYP